MLLTSASLHSVEGTDSPSGWHLGGWQQWCLVAVEGLLRPLGRTALQPLQVYPVPLWEMQGTVCHHLGIWHYGAQCQIPRLRIPPSCSTLM